MTKTSVSNDNGVASLTAHRMTQVVRRALEIREAAEAFEATWPPLARRPPMPVFAWTELERQLRDLAPEAMSGVVHDLISAIRKEAEPKPPEMVLREILIVAAAVLDEGFQERWAEDTTMP